MPERTLRKDAQERRQIILEKAAQLFARYGVENVSMRHIAREAGVGQGTLYRSYTNKGELCWDLIGESCIQNKDKMERYLLERSSSSLKERLETVLAYHLESLETHSPLLAAMQTNNNSEEERSASFYNEHYESIHSLIVRLLEEYKESNGTSKMDPVFRADAILSTMAPEMYLFLKEQRHYTSDEIRDKLFNTYVEPLFL
ncbi:transcriptional regulator, TetR family [Paenibacillus sp. UNC496MF]|uniref:TetR/AcrR family transcriptional regulator n=1 Tax=Paenibacillus sp. UNC496MF TaxID=1502753 RepID=UPI0008EE2A6A|nr:TetR/AcrR family transcriptional regulator [Paenibacillus sp. UNC496MF]SFJ58276.1 transcriptional regulator, TetR family [Paenibacillus sp. UNC496MF]